MTTLERYEWCEFWWEEATSFDKKRVLLIGDSITRAYHPHVNQLLKDVAYVDKLATSKALDNPSLFQEVDYMLKHRAEFQYDVVHFNNGLHGFHLSKEEYKHHYENMLQHLKEHTKAVIVLGLSTPVTIDGDPIQINPSINDKVLERNQAVIQLADQAKVLIHDLYTPLVGRDEYRVNDGYHYNVEGEKAQAVWVANTIKPLLI
jgi:hypothetical protein